MKILVISDTHLGEKFEEKKYLLLEKVITAADKVILNGDFWDGYVTSFDQFLNSAWNKLFPLLKQKKAVYLYGNHDLKDWSDHRTSNFSIIQAKSYDLMLGNKKFHFEHGDRLAPVSKVLHFLIDFEHKTLNTYSLVHFCTALMEVTVRFFGLPFFKFARRFTDNKVKRNWSLESDGRFLVCGHTHGSEINMDLSYANSGMMRHGISQCLFLDTTTGTLELVEGKY